MKTDGLSQTARSVILDTIVDRKRLPRGVRLMSSAIGTNTLPLSPTSQCTRLETVILVIGSVCHAGLESDGVRIVGLGLYTRYIDVALGQWMDL